MLSPKVDETGDSIDWLILRDPDFVDMRGDGINDTVNQGDTVNEGMNDPINDPINKSQYDEIPSAQLSVLQLLVKNNKESYESMAQQLDISSTTVKRHLKWLREHKYIVRHGAKKDGYWEVIVK